MAKTTKGPAILLAAVVLAAPAVAQSPTTPTEWPKLRGPWVLVLPDKHIFINPDSLVRLRGDTISVLERIDSSDDHTTTSRYLLACATHSTNDRWMKFYFKGKKASFENMVGTLPEWERESGNGEVVGGGKSTPWRKETAICQLAGQR